MKKYHISTNSIQKILQKYYSNPHSFQNLKYKQNNFIFKQICESRLHNYYFQQLIPLMNVLNQNVIQYKTQYKTQICYIIMALSKLNIYNSQIFQIFEDVYLNEPTNYFTIQDLLSAYWAYFKLRFSNKKAMQKLSQDIFKKINDQTNIETIIQALYIFLCKPPQNIKLISDLYIRLLKNLNNELVYNRKTTTQILTIKYLQDRVNLKFQDQQFLNMYNTSLYICQMNHKFQGVKQLTYKNIDNQSSIINLIDRKGLHSSITQIIVSQYLNNNYYQFERNVLIGGFQYDFLITKKRQRKTPLKNKKKDNTNQNFQKIVLEINGPIHYITSDLKENNNLIIATSELKSQLLKKFNIKHYRQFNVKEWQAFELFPKKKVEYLKKLIEIKSSEK